MKEKNKTGTGDDVQISVELSGSYDAVTSKLSATESSKPVPESFLGDTQQILETVVRIDGGTRSRITEALPEEMAVEYDSELLVEFLQVLLAYELVELEGNTWKPGPRLGVDTAEK